MRTAPIRSAASDEGGPFRSNSLLVLVATVLVALPLVLGGLITSSSADTTSGQLADSVAVPTAASLTPSCQLPNPAATLGPKTSLPASPVTQILSTGHGVLNFAATSSALYVNDNDGHLLVYSTSGALLTTISIPSTMNASGVVSHPVIDPSGNIYLASYYGQVINEYSSTGTLVASHSTAPNNPTGIFGVTVNGAFALGVSVTQVKTSSRVLNPASGWNQVSTAALTDDFGFVTTAADGDLLYSAGGYVQTYDPTGATLLATFGNSTTEGVGLHTGSGHQFFYQGAAVQASDGTIYTADPLTTIEETSPQGFLKGSTTLGGNLAMGSGDLALIGNTLYFVSGPPFNTGGDAISTVTLNVVQQYLAAPAPTRNTLGWGAGLTTPVAGNYFSAGTTPTVQAAFDPWWVHQASSLQLHYAVVNVAQQAQSGAVQSVDAQLANNTLSVPGTDPNAPHPMTVSLPIPAQDQTPGPYEVEAVLVDTATSPPTTLGTACLPYTVGASGNGLSLASLPTGISGGGPSDPRGVALNAQLGLSGFRSTSPITWSTYLPQCNPSAPTAATCGSGAMTFANATNAYYQASAEALADHVAYWIQVSGGDATSMALVEGGWWEGDIAALVAHYAHVPANCGTCAPVTNWEPWNEPNNTGWTNGGTFTQQVLAPFYQAVKSVLPGTQSTVIGGSTSGLDGSAFTFWQQLVAAGGLADLDVAGIHPYTGNNDAFEEDGEQAQIQAIENLVAPRPVWITEVGWWSDGPYDQVHQADAVARAMIWQRLLNIPVWNYFFDEGNWGNDNVSFSLIQVQSGDDYVKPAALATMEAHTELSGFSGTPTLVPTGIPHAYDAAFGPTDGSGPSLQAVWSDGLDVTSQVTVHGSQPLQVATEYGDTETAAVTSDTPYALPLSDSVTYLEIPAGDTVSVSPTAPYGSNLALASAGATATATSVLNSQYPASAAINGPATSVGQGWASSENGRDPTPTLTVTLPQTTTINRVVVDTQSLGSTAPGDRDFTVDVLNNGAWTTEAQVTGEYWNHTAEIDFPPISASGVRVTVTEVNAGGYDFGGVPPFWPVTQSVDAFVHSLEVFAGTADVATIDATALPLLDPSIPTTTTTTTPTTPTTSTTTTTTTTTVPDSTTTTTTTTTTTVPDSTTTTGPKSTTTTTTTTPPDGQGYTLATANGMVLPFGSAGYYGQAAGIQLRQPIVGMAPTPDHRGYWLVASDGGIFTFGDATFYGSTGNLQLNKPIVGMAATPDGHGYWLVASDGGVFTFGDAAFYGSTGAMTLNKPIVGMASTPDGRGYWLVASDGGIFTFGDATFFGSTGDIQLAQPIVGMAPTAGGQGYWLVASDGGIFTFGDATFYGSTGAIHLAAPVVGMASDPDGEGYWLFTADSGVFAFGSAHYEGSDAANPYPTPVVGGA